MKKIGEYLNSCYKCQRPTSHDILKEDLTEQGYIIYYGKCSICQEQYKLEIHKMEVYRQDAIIT